MAAAEVQLSLSQSDRSTLDTVLKPHLRLEPQRTTREQKEEEEEEIMSPEPGSELRLGESVSSQNGRGLQRRLPAQRSTSTTSSQGTAGGIRRATVLQSTIEADNKRRPVVLKRNSSRYEPPSPEPPDPHSEAKSQTIRRMQSNLEEWDKQLQEICEKKSKNDTVLHSELVKRDGQITDLTEKYTIESELRTNTEQERDQLAQNLATTEADLADHRQQAQQLQADLAQYEVAYQQLELRRNEQEQELANVSEQLDQSEAMRRRLNDQVTELQGQLAIEEQRSRFCVLL